MSSAARDWGEQQPGSYSEWCLNRIASALETMAAAGTEAQPDLVELAEDFPGREQLAEAGVIFLDDVPATGAGLAGLGLDGMTVNRILTRLKTER